MSLPLSELFDHDVENHLIQDVGSQNFAMLLDYNEIFDNSSSFTLSLHNALPTQDENTLPVPDVKFQPPHQRLLSPILAADVLSNEDYGGPYGFEVSVLPTYNTKNPWVYSVPLNKVYMDMMQPFPIDIILKTPKKPNDKLFIRITPQYSAQNYAANPVCRCFQHDHHSDSTNKDIAEHVRQHVIRSTNKAAYYLGDAKEKQRLSVILPMGNPQAGSESVREFLFFVCKSSCPVPGMNRRTLEVIFTLEDEEGSVLGRKALNVRICACPKRDKEKEEKEAEKSNHTSPPKGKKRKVDQHPTQGSKMMPPDDRAYKINLPCVGKQSLLKILTHAEDVHQSQLYLAQGQPELSERLKKTLHEIEQLKRAALQ
ncbi:cellular tumor antigen p53 isoform X2 [Euwallacea fornicatus]|uniref:cellular tumor antigen p53 isoform X2 n=1 Tax=Euwallacea fornicatus TaxID=995702 RepID=UPI0033903E82